VLAGTFAAFAIFAFFLSRRRWMGPAAIALFFGVVALAMVTRLIINAAPA
jgi:hypothetical protein